MENYITKNGIKYELRGEQYFPMLEISEQAHEQIDLHIVQMAERMGVTEELKVSDPMRWMQMMNNIKAITEEIILKEVIYK